MSSVLVFLEAKNDQVTRISLEALAAAAALAETFSLRLNAALVGAPSDAVFTTIKGKAPHTVYAVEHEKLHAYTSDGYCEAYAQLIQSTKPTFVLFPHTYQVRDFAPRLATRFGQVLISDVTSWERFAGDIAFLRPLMQGKLNAAYRATTLSEHSPCFLSVQAGAFRADLHVPGETILEPFLPSLGHLSIRTVPGEPFRASAQTVDLGSAPILVSVGRGIKEAANIPIVQELATALGAEMAASRPICDAGWLPMERQVGSSGQTVAPKLYIAIGISGAIQHLVGMKGSQCIVAINKDETAPIFEVADYGIVGDLFDVVPALTAAVKARA